MENEIVMDQQRLSQMKSNSILPFDFNLEHDPEHNPDSEHENDLDLGNIELFATEDANAITSVASGMKKEMEMEKEKEKEKENLSENDTKTTTITNPESESKFKSESESELEKEEEVGEGEGEEIESKTMISIIDKEPERIMKDSTEIEPEETEKRKPVVTANIATLTETESEIMTMPTFSTPTIPSTPLNNPSNTAHVDISDNNDPLHSDIVSTNQNIPTTLQTMMVTTGTSTTPPSSTSTTTTKTTTTSSITPSPSNKTTTPSVRTRISNIPRPISRPHSSRPFSSRSLSLSSRPLSRTTRIDRPSTTTRGSIIRKSENNTTKKE
ncbi:hypothetical protein PIROE2DRAFT_9505 [Piromyces sp. E2]|nr:hypothetical protein PIROE2DRAFT_9505 [Piromyces sp. E2]|eukprot:OUM63898.1 hypothetical protein PIROE2DRAFT_9505 [Piromyces sp. E2]